VTEHGYRGGKIGSRCSDSNTYHPIGLAAELIKFVKI
jgi:hypothetical protein